MDENRSRAERLGSEQITRLLIKFSVPAMVGMMVNALYNIVDRIFIGRGVDSVAIGGIFVGMPLMLIFMGFGMLIGIGGNTLVSIRLGEGNKEEADKIANNSLLLLFIAGIILSLTGYIFLRPVLMLFGASESNIGYAMDYLRIILIGAPFQAIGFGMNNFIRGEGNPKVAMFTMLIGAILNIILDPIFIFVFNMGVQGAALATIISQFVSAVWVLRYFLSGNSILNIGIKYMKLEFSIVKRIIANGFAPFSMQIAASMVTALYNNNLQSYGGDLAVSTMGVINSVSMMILMPVFGLNQGAQPIMGFNYGAQKFNRVKKALIYSIIAATTITSFGFIITQFFPELIVGLFVGDTENAATMMEIAIPAMRRVLLMLPILGFQIISTSYFQATGRPKQAMLLSLSRQVLFLIPLIIILPKIFGLIGVWSAGPTADLLSSLVAAVLIIGSIRHLK